MWVLEGVDYYVYLGYEHVILKYFGTYMTILQQKCLVNCNYNTWFLVEEIRVKQLFSNTNDKQMRWRE